MTNKVTRTAPQRIWLQVSDDELDAKAAFPEPSQELTWCADSVMACEVEYVRADLVRAAMPVNWFEDRDVHRLGLALGMEEEHD